MKLSQLLLLFFFRLFFFMRKFSRCVLPGGREKKITKAQTWELNVGFPAVEVTRESNWRRGGRGRVQAQDVAGNVRGNAAGAAAAAAHLGEGQKQATLKISCVLAGERVCRVESAR